METFLADRRTVERRQRLLPMFTLAIRSVQIYKTRPAVRLLILRAVILGYSYFAVRADNFFWVPVLSVSDNELGIILPLVLSGISHHVFMSKDCQFLISWTHIY